MLQFLAQVSALVVVPALALIWLANSRADHVYTLGQLTTLTGYFALLILVAPWSFVWYPVRIIFLLFLCLLGARVLVRLCRTPWSYPNGGGESLKALSWIVTGWMVWALMIPVVNGLRTPTVIVNLTFPLEGGVFVVGHGGSNAILNYHSSHHAQRYALDITQLNAAGLRAWGVYPQELDRYAIYGARVVSPCAGRIVAMQDGLPDLIPPQRDSKNPAGNHIVIECEDVAIYLAHLRRGGMQVKVGDSVKTRELLGFVGNSGNTSEPHLHIHAQTSYAGISSPQPGVALAFDGRYLVRNSVVRR